MYTYDFIVSNSKYQHFSGFSKSREPVSFFFSHCIETHCAYMLRARIIRLVLQIYLGCQPSVDSCFSNYGIFNY